MPLSSSLALMNFHRTDQPSGAMRALGRSRQYTLVDLPARLRHWHAPRANRWEYLRVTAGCVDIEWIDATDVIPQTLGVDAVRWIAPGTRWRVARLDAHSAFVLEIHADDALPAAAPQPVRTALLDAAACLRPADAADLHARLAALVAGEHYLLRTAFDPTPSMRAAIDAAGGHLSWHPLAAGASEHVALVVRSAQPVGLLEYLGRDHALIEAALAGALHGDAERECWMRNALARHLVIEEEWLFPAYLAGGGNAGWVRGLCNEHRHLRRDIDHLDDPPTRRRFLLLLDGHDEKEEQLVYPDILARAVDASTLHAQVMRLAASEWPSAGR